MKRPTQIERVLAVAALLTAATAGALVAATDWRIYGNRAISENRILTILRSTPGGQVKALRVVQEAYFDDGFFSANLSVELGTDSVRVVTIDEGPRARVAAISVKGASALSSEEIRAEAGLRPGNPFRASSLRNGIDRVLRRYDDSGYPWAQVWLDSLAWDAQTNTVRVALSVVEGTPRDIASVVVEGLERTRSNVAMKIVDIKPGTPYRARTVEQGYLRLAASGLFESVERPSVRLAADGTGVEVVMKVRETAGAGEFDAALGYAASDASGTERVISGLVRLDLSNISGSMKDFGLFWSNDGVQRSVTRVHYRDRFFLGRIFTVGLELEQIGQDTLYTWQTLGLEAARPVGRLRNGLVTVGAAFNGDRNVFSSGELLRSWRYRGTVSTRYLRGSRLRAGFADILMRFSLASKDNTFRSDSTQSVSQWMFEMEGDVTGSLARSVHLRFVPVFRTLESDESSVPLSEQFYIGGARTLRGYREDQFHGRRVGTLSTELLFGPSPRENLYLFVDAGYVRQLTDGISSEQWPVGFGFGFRTGSPLGNIDLSFAMGDEISLQQTKVHVLLRQNF